jgi:hypothetical protein
MLIILWLLVVVAVVISKLELSVVLAVVLVVCVAQLRQVVEHLEQ